MLVLTRDIGQSVIITDQKTGEKIKVVITRVNEYGQIRLGFDCDKTKFTIFREEILNEKLGE